MLLPLWLNAFTVLNEKHEQGREVERGTFSPLVFSCCGGMGPTATVVYKQQLATLTSEKRSHPYSPDIILD